MASDRGVEATYGVIGVGSIAAAIVDGLCAGEEDDAPHVLLSPRNAATAGAVAARHPSAKVAADNQAVLDGADTLLVCLRLADAEATLAPLNFRPEHRVISVVSGLSSARLAELCGPAGEISRAVPLPVVAARRGTTPVFPAGSAAAAMFRKLGDVMELDDETVFEVFTAASSTVAAHFTYLDAIAGWMAAHGAPRAGADALLAAVFGGLHYDLHGGSVGDLGRAHTTPGGTNALMGARMRAAGLPQATAEALDAVLARLTGGG